MLLSTLSLNSGKETKQMKSTKFANANKDWEYKAERQQEKKSNKALRDARKSRKLQWQIEA